MEKTLKIIFGITGILLLIIGGALFYEFCYLPLAVKLSPPDKLPFFSVYYLYRLEPEYMTTFKFGSQEVSTFQLGKTIKNDMKLIKGSGFDGIKILFHFKQDNYIANRITLKAAEQNLYPVGILVGYNAKPTDRAFTEQELKEWDLFVRYEVRKNKNIIYYWEIWNEPAEGMFRYGNSDEYLSLLKRTYAIIKQENPKAKVIVTLDTYHIEQDRFSQQFLSAGGAEYFDILSFHPYAANPYIQEDKFNIAFANAKEMGAKINKPLWITEIGQPTSEVSEQKQAELAEFVLRRAYEEKTPLIWFYYSDQRAATVQITDNSYGWGLLDGAGKPKPLFNAFKDFISTTTQSNTST